MSPIARPSRDQVLVFETVEQLRGWFEANHDSAGEAFIGHYRKGVPKVSVSYAQIVEEALCFGWIDGVTFRVDDEVTANRYTPRRRGSSWSAVNIARVAELRAAGRMHQAGIRAFEERDRRKDAIYSYEGEPQELPPDLRARLGADAAAWSYWQSETPSYRRSATHWVLTAKRPETRERRFASLAADSAEGRRVKPFLVSAADRRS